MREPSITILLILGSVLAFADAGIFDWSMGWSRWPSTSSKDKENPLGSGVLSRIGKGKPRSNENKGITSVNFGNGIYNYDQYVEINNNKCIETVKLLWKPINVEKVFQSECKRGMEIYNFHYETLLMIGSPTSDLCILSIIPDVFYYKDNNKWRKVTVKEVLDERIELSPSNPLKSDESDMDDAEIKKMKENIKKLKPICDPYKEEIDKMVEANMSDNRRIRDLIKSLSQGSNEEFLNTFIAIGEEYDRMLDSIMYVAMGIHVNQKVHDDFNDVMEKARSHLNQGLQSSNDQNIRNLKTTIEEHLQKKQELFRKGRDLNVEFRRQYEATGIPPKTDDT
ncbi:uncharacterized protein LOC128999750 [Macrosteles quadrilineatus]|uniref:uncharacterized protein LOC128999750 n=1 Tax=Macrosteles quadrilineatus TaxID=74068 RepID=UPI0023E1EF74|nr:uncharacterized protein LOC128999750 [Macrosteles quadrilineatus]